MSEETATLLFAGACIALGVLVILGGTLRVVRQQRRLRRAPLVRGTVVGREQRVVRSGDGSVRLSFVRVQLPDQEAPVEVQLPRGVWHRTAEGDEIGVGEVRGRWLVPGTARLAILPVVVVGGVFIFFGLFALLYEA